MDSEAVLDMLMDLQHDLGKYIVLPFNYLAPDAPQYQIRAALGNALLLTRQTPQGIRSARDIWTSFCNESAGCFENSVAFRILEEAVAGALMWESSINALGYPLDRVMIEYDLKKVPVAIRGLIEEQRRAR